MDNREALLGYGPHGFALEVNPWQSKTAVENALLYRGTFVAGWANVEGSLIELAIRASCDPHYLSHRDAYPSTVKSRVTYLDEILDLPGPLNAYGSLIRAVLYRYRKYEDFRNIMAHARMSILPEWGATFHVFKAKSGKEISYRTLRLTEAQLEWYALRAAKFSRAVRRLICSLDQRQLLPPLKAAE